MKTLIFLAVLIQSLVVSANCIGEAQIIAKAGSLKRKTYSSCTMNIEPGSVKMYNINQTCPLLLEDALNEGVDVGIKDGHDCALSSGDDLTGVIYIGADGQIHLE